MKGSITLRRDKKGKVVGNYRIAISLGRDRETGKYKQYFETLPPGSSKAEAQKRLRALLIELDRGAFVKPVRLTVGAYLEQWLNDYCVPNLAPNTTQTYRFFIHRHIIPAIGSIPLNELKPEHLQHLYAEKLASGRKDSKGGLSNRSVRYVHITLHKALKSALRLGMVNRSVADSVDCPKTKRGEMRIMTETDIHILLEYAKSTLYYPLFYLALFSGMRRSEILALKWFDVDLELCQLSVNRTLHQLNNRDIITSQPKTARGRRLIALTPSTVAVLREHRQVQMKLRQAIGTELTDDDYVFCQYDGKPLLPDSVTQAWRNLAKRTGLRGVRLHDCRHAHASLRNKRLNAPTFSRR